MKGLLIKDIHILKSFIMYLALMLGIGVVVEINSDFPFMISYLTIVSMMIVINTMNYDEFNHGMAYLLTMPITRKDYVKEKYLFGMILTSIMWLVAFIVSYMINDISVVYEFVGSAVLILLVEWMMMSVLIPTQIYFGQRKGNVAIVMVMVTLMVILFGGGYLMKLLGIDIINVLNSMQMEFVLGIGILLFMVVMWISYRISVLIITKKEY